MKEEMESMKEAIEQIKEKEKDSEKDSTFKESHKRIENLAMLGSKREEFQEWN